MLIILNHYFLLFNIYMTYDVCDIIEGEGP